MMPTQSESKSYMKGCDFLTLHDGSTYHLGTKPGEVNQRILTVGSESRARKVALNCFDKGIESVISSNRSMYTFNGTVDGVPVSIIAIGMGAPMMDFMIREASYCQPKPIACIRLGKQLQTESMFVGTCGILSSAEPGTVMVAENSMYSYINYGYQSGGHVGGKPEDSEKPFFLSKPISSTSELTKGLIDCLKNTDLRYEVGLNSCGETFYACQGRLNDDFEDHNEHILGTLIQEGVSSMEMETHQLYSLAMRRRVPLYTSAANIGIVSRSTTKPVTAEELNRMEIEAGRQCLRALVNFKSL